MTDQSSREYETLDNLRDRQEQAWQRGERLLVESLADEVSSLARDAKLLILITAEVTLRKQLGENCTSVEYLQRFPQFAEALRIHFASLETEDQKVSLLAETHSFIAGRPTEQAFSVGLIYGPSGCGKSSLVKAGLLPHLSKDVAAVYLEATPDETETRILRGLEKRLPELSKGQNLTDTLTSLQRGQGGAKKGRHHHRPVRTMAARSSTRPGL
jgi:predicted AAA+ superfamily ATPase